MIFEFLSKAKDIFFDKSNSELNSTNIQSAIEELESNISITSESLYLNLHGEVEQLREDTDTSIKSANTNIDNAVNTLEAMGDIKLLGTVQSLQSGTVSAQINSINGYRYIVLRVHADGYIDTKMLPVGLAPIYSNGGYKGIRMKIYASDDYFWEGNIGFDSVSAVRISTIATAGWTGTVYIYGVL